MGVTKIEWAHYTWNPWYGCKRVSAACDNCYAANWGARTGKVPKWGEVPRRSSPEVWAKPRLWNARSGLWRSRVFTLSLGDFFDERVPSAWRVAAWNMIYECKELDWLILTKRPQNIASMLPTDYGNGWDHVWLGTTVENQKSQHRIAKLLRIPAPVHFLSCEPLLEPLDLRPYLGKGPRRINWVIVGGETGAGRTRWSDPDWFREIEYQCAETEAAFFMKQMTDKAPIPHDLIGARCFPTTRLHDTGGN